jgi:hypothetical protein
LSPYWLTAIAMYPMKHITLIATHWYHCMLLEKPPKIISTSQEAKLSLM